MKITARIPDRKVISSSLSDINRIRLSSPAISIKPSLFLEDLTDVTTVDAVDDNILLFSETTNQFNPRESADVFTVGTIFGGTF